MHWRIEPVEEVQRHRCDVCGREHESVHGYVYRHDVAFAVYHSTLDDHDGKPVLHIAVSLGDWSEEAGGSLRYRVGMRVWTDGDEVNLSVESPVESPWEDSSALGRMLPRDEALAHPELPDLFGMTEVVIRHDRRIGSLLNLPKL